MKTLKIFSIFVAIVAITFVGCEKSESNFEFKPNENSEQVENILTRYKDAQQLASFHSDGLKYVFKQIQERQAQFENNKDAQDVQRLDSIIDNIIIKYIVQDAVQVEFKKLNTLKFSENKHRQSGLMKSASAGETTKNQTMKFFDETIDKVSYINTSNSTDVFNSAIQSTEFAEFQEEEQNELLLMFAVFVDSEQYWDENIENWLNLLITYGTPNDSLYQVLNQNQTVDKKRLKDIAKADAEGLKNTSISDVLVNAILSAIEGAGIGAVTGAAVAGVGSVPGAAIGGVAGLGKGTISAYIGNAIRASLEEASKNCTGLSVRI